VALDAVNESVIFPGSSVFICVHPWFSTASFRLNAVVTWQAKQPGQFLAPAVRAVELAAFQPATLTGAITPPSGGTGSLQSLGRRSRPRWPRCYRPRPEIRPSNVLLPAWSARRHTNTEQHKRENPSPSSCKSSGTEATTLGDPQVKAGVSRRDQIREQIVINLMRPSRVRRTTRGYAPTDLLGLHEPVTAFRVAIQWQSLSSHARRELPGNTFLRQQSHWRSNLLIPPPIY